MLSTTLSSSQHYLRRARFRGEFRLRPARGERLRVLFSKSVKLTLPVAALYEDTDVPKLRGKAKGSAG
jgi:hypothetical protein